MQKKKLIFMVCTFFGHKDAPSSIKMRLEEIIEALINEGVKNYYVGNNGNFDFYVQGVLENIVKKTQRYTFFSGFVYNK